jgi:hypothetical protein
MTEMSAFMIRTNMHGRRALRVWPTRVAGVVIVFLAVFLAIMLGRNDQTPASHSKAAGCAPDTITLVSSHQKESRAECLESARAKTRLPAGFRER